MPLSPGFDTCGWFAREIGKFARVDEVLLGDDTVPLPARPEILLPADVLAGLDEPVASEFKAMLGKLAGQFGKPVSSDIMSPMTDALYWFFRYLHGRQAWRSQGADVQRYDLQLGPGVRERFAWSSTITQAQHDERAAVQ
jgi:amidase